MRRHRRDYEILSDMNLTNLLDTAFVLLITFIIASPTIRQGMEMNLPQVEAASNLQASTNTVQIDIKKSELAGAEDPIYIDEMRVDLPTLQRVLEKKKVINPKLDVIINAERTASVDMLYQVIAVLKVLQIESVGLPTEPMAPPEPGTKTKNKKKP